MINIIHVASLISSFPTCRCRPLCFRLGCLAFRYYLFEKFTHLAAKHHVLISTFSWWERKWNRKSIVVTRCACGLAAWVFGYWRMCVFCRLVTFRLPRLANDMYINLLARDQVGLACVNQWKTMGNGRMDADAWVWVWWQWPILATAASGDMRDLRWAHLHPSGTLRAARWTEMASTLAKWRLQNNEQWLLLLVTRSGARE